MRRNGMAWIRVWFEVDDDQGMVDRVKDGLLVNGVLRAERWTSTRDYRNTN